MTLKTGLRRCQLEPTGKAFWDTEPRDRYLPGRGGTLLELIRWQMETRLDKRVIEHAVLLATGHKRESCEIREHGPGALLPIEPEQSPFLWKLVCSQIPTNGSFALTQFLPVAPVATVPKTAEPLEAVSLADDGPNPYYLPALAPFVARSTDLIQSTKSGRQLFCLG